MNAIQAYFDFYRGVHDILIYDLYRRKEANLIKQIKKNRPETINQCKADFEFWISDKCNQYALLDDCLAEIKNGLFLIPKENHASYIWDKILPLVLLVKNYFNIRFDENGKNLNLGINDERNDSNRYETRYGTHIIDIQNIIIKDCVDIDAVKTDYEKYIVCAFHDWLNFVNRIHALCFSFGISFIQLQIDKGIQLTNWYDRGSLDYLGYPYDKQLEEIKIFNDYLKEKEVENELKKGNLFFAGYNTLANEIEKQMSAFRNAFNSASDYEKAKNTIAEFFNGRSIKISSPLFVKNGNVKKLAFALGEIWRSQKNGPVTYEYLSFYKKAFSIFANQIVDESQVFGSPLYKYSISKT